MRYSEVVYSRKRNLGNYESESIELRAIIDEHDNADDVINAVMVKAAEYLFVQPKADKIVEVVEGGDCVMESGKTVDGGTGEEVKPKKKKKVAKKVTKAKPKKENITLDQVKDGLKSVWKAKGKSIAMDILDSFDVTKSDDLKEDDYAKVLTEVERCLK